MDLNWGGVFLKKISRFSIKYHLLICSIIILHILIINPLFGNDYESIKNNKFNDAILDKISINCAALCSDYFIQLHQEKLFTYHDINRIFDITSPLNPITDIRDACQEFGIESTVIRINYEQACQLGGPMIAHTYLTPFNHFVVIECSPLTGVIAFIPDVLKKSFEMKYISENEWNEIFSGVCLIANSTLEKIKLQKKEQINSQEFPIGFNHPNWIFNDKKCGQIHNHYFCFRNTTNTSLTLKFKNIEGAAILKEEYRTVYIAPDELKPIPIGLDGIHFNGDVKGSVEAYIKDSEDKSIKITIAGKLYDYPISNPQFIDFGELNAFETHTKQIFLSGVSIHNIPKKVDVKCSFANVTTNLLINSIEDSILIQNESEDPPIATYEITVSTNENNVGSFSGSIEFEFQLNKQTIQRIIPFQGRFVLPVTPNPSIAYIDKKALKTDIRLISNEESRYIQIDRVVSSNKAIHAYPSVSESSDESERNITIEIDPIELKHITNNPKVDIHFSQPDSFVISIPIRIIGNN